MENLKSTEAFLLGFAYAGMSKVQEHLIHCENKEALNVLNESMRKLNEEINKHFYGKEPIKPEGITNDAV
jgi:hypothetical protein